MSKKKFESPVFYSCPMCGNIVEMIYDSGMPLICCGSEMELLKAASTDGAKEKHVPVYCIENNQVIVKVGSEPHPMTPDHYIQWIELVTSDGIYRKMLCPNTEPTICFPLCEDETPIEVYAYCNIHGLWKK